MDGPAREEAVTPSRRVHLRPAALALLLCAVFAVAACSSPPEDSYYNRGVRHQEEGRLPAAARAYRKAIDEDPEDAESHYNLGTVYHEIGKKRKAKASYETALRQRDEPRAHVNLAALLEEQGQTAEALRHLDAAVALDGESAFPLCFRGAFHERQGDHERALADFRAGIAAEPYDADCHRRLGKLLWMQEMWEESRLSLEKATRLDAGSRPAWLALGELAREMDDVPAAIRAYQRLASLEPDRLETFLALGELYLIRGQPTRAILALERAAALAPPDTPARRLRLRATIEQLSAEVDRALEADLPDEELDRLDRRLAEIRGRLEASRASAAASDD